MKFIADSMLGKLARWLRFLGYDTLYHPYYEDQAIIDQASTENRIVLTKDRELVKALTSKDIRTLLIEANRYEEQLKQIARKLDIRRTPSPFTRCSVCNGSLESLGREKARELVPPYVYEIQQKFFICPNCKRVYWAGSHQDSINLTLKKIFEK